MLIIFAYDPMTLVVKIKLALDSAKWLSYNRIRRHDKYGALDHQNIKERNGERRLFIWQLAAS
jgi:hypothetical protein